MLHVASLYKFDLQVKCQNRNQDNLLHFAFDEHFWAPLIWESNQADTSHQVTLKDWKYHEWLWFKWYLLWVIPRSYLDTMFGHFRSLLRTEQVHRRAGIFRKKSIKLNTFSVLLCKHKNMSFCKPCSFFPHLNNTHSWRGAIRTAAFRWVAGAWTKQNKTLRLLTICQNYCVTINLIV